MTVTGIEEISKTKSRVFIDGTFAFVLYKGELRKYGIVKGDDIAEESLLTLKERVLPKRAKLRAMNLLQSRRYTEKQLLDRLHLGGYSDEVARAAIDYVKSYRYIDDTEYAYDYISCHMDMHSRREIEQKLMQKGIDKETIRVAMERHREYGEEPDEKELIRKLLRKKNCFERKLEEKEKQRIYGYLYRKGFSTELVRQVLSEREPLE